jgi:hypothetical protein
MKKIKNINYLTKLKTLDCSYDCGINQGGINDLKLTEELYADNNEKIKNVSRLTKLKILYCFDDCGIDQEGIKDLKIIDQLDASNNKKIKNVNHLTELIFINGHRIKNKIDISYYLQKN